MGVLSILARLAFDGTQFDSGIKKAERTADKFANKTMNKLGGLAAGAFGANALKNIGKQAMENAHSVVQMANKFNLTTDEVQLLKQESDRTGESFESLVKDAGRLEETLSKLRGGEVIFSKKQIESLDQAHEVINEFKSGAARTMAKAIENPMGALKALMAPFAGKGGMNAANEFFAEEPLNEKEVAFLEAEAKKKRAAQARLDAEEKSKDKIAQMEKQTAELKEKAIDAGMTKEQQLQRLLEKRGALNGMLGPENAETMAIRNLEGAKLDAAIAELRGGLGKPETRKQLSPLSDSLTSVGNFLGGSTNSPQMKLLDDANRLLRQIEKNTGRQGGTAFPL
jgi:hypothetical protein